MKRFSAFFFALIVVGTLFSLNLAAQQKPPRVWTAEEQPIVDGIKGLRKVPDQDRGRVTKDLALKIRALPAGKDKSDLAVALAHLSTEGDFGRDNLQEVTTTLTIVLRESPIAPTPKEDPPEPYTWLASLVRYEHMKTSLDDAQYSKAMAQLAEQDKKLQNADFTLTDTAGKSWNLKSLRGKVVLVNFWATWCPPCRKEMPDLDALAKEYAKQGLVVVGLSDEEPAVVTAFLAKQTYTYPILLDAGHKVAAEFGVEGIPKSFVYDREGKLVAQSIDMRTREQFKQMVAEAGVK